MFVRLFLVILSVAVLTRAATVTGNRKSMEAVCDSYLYPMCPRDYSPVCGSDGKTYANECMFCLDAMAYNLNTYIVRKGEC
ncbi:trypsin inhibitor ClTI-1-like [Tachysurus fulvidraco]|uniref:trypsin inhibitor ClTI-1-like n=1 Tax=Tachysurus fulvidraco TaxID=1234273 RepID=UPI000F4FDE62|nr:trypsin inhibitor ClTI-1-like [Tachysurus fulvidraco]